MTSLRLLVFDCDGTLVDSQFMIIAAMNEAFDALGQMRPDDNAVRRVVGLSLADAILRLLPGAGPGLLGGLVERYKKAFRRAREDGGREPLYPGARDAVLRLSESGYLLSVATGKSRRGLIAVLEHHGLQNHFVSLQTADDAPGKPHPAMLYQAMAEAGAEAHDTVMIGDTTYDVEMARAAHVRALGVSWGYHGADDLMAAGACGIVHNFAALEAIMPQLFLKDSVI